MKKNPYLNNYFKTIVCDVDDTISTAITHDWLNALPIKGTIDKINKLYDLGWTIILSTARGQISCNGDFLSADKKYRVIMLKWLKHHGVKYHMLSFLKYLASYYIDDKGLTPELFQELDIREIKTGWSGARIEKRGDRIYKTHKDSLDAAKWYNMASPLINVPIIYNVIGNTIAMEYLNSNGQRFKLNNINEIIEIFSLYKTYIPFLKYILRMENHCNYNNMFHEILEPLRLHELTLNKFNTFCHGDFSIENLIQTDKGLFLIDPIWHQDNWSSYLLDISKMLHSFRKYNRMFEYEVFLNTWVKKGLNRELLYLLEITQFIRVIKYIPDELLKKYYILLTTDLINNYMKYREL